MSEAEAREIAHPVPSNVTCLMRSPSRSRNTVSRSPHRGLNPSHTRSASSSRRKFRGVRLWSRMTSWYSSRRSDTIWLQAPGCGPDYELRTTDYELRTSSKQLVRFVKRSDERVHITARVVEREGRTGRRRDPVAVHDRLRAVLASPNGHAFVVEHRTDIVRVYAVHDERQHARLLA